MSTSTSAWRKVRWGSTNSSAQNPVGWRVPSDNVQWSLPESTISIRAMEYLLDDPTVFVDMLPLTLPAVLDTQVRKLSASLDLKARPLQRARSARTGDPSTLTTHRLVRRNAEAGIVQRKPPLCGTDDLEMSR